MLTLAVLLSLSYLMGSFPTSVIVARRAKGIDIREHGSGNAGGTNVLRIVGWKAALLVAVVDVGKGSLAAAIPFIVSTAAGSSLTVLHADDASALCGACAVVGHIFPVFARFRGGKGVGTSAGMHLVIQPLAVACAAPIFLVTVFTTRWVSLGSVFGALALPVATALIRGGPWISLHPISFGTTAFLSCLIVFKHRENLARIVRGTESRLGKKIPPGPTGGAP